MTKIQAVVRLNEIIRNSPTRYEFMIKSNDWCRDDVSRTYFEIVEFEPNKKTSKHYVVRPYGYIDNITGEYVPGKNDLRNNYTFSGSTF